MSSPHDPFEDLTWWFCHECEFVWEDYDQFVCPICGSADIDPDGPAA